MSGYGSGASGRVSGLGVTVDGQVLRTCRRVNVPTHFGQGGEEMGKAEDNSGNGGQETAKTSFCWTYGGKEGREVFNLETTISGTLSEADIESHITSALRAMGAVFRHGGRAKWVGGGPAPQISTSRDSARGLTGYEWGRGRTGRSVLLVHKNASEPDEIECPVHPGKMMSRRSNEGGSWLSHKEGDSFCTVRIQAALER